MIVHEISNEWRDPATIEYRTEETDIDEIIRMYGRANDTLLLFDDEMNLVAGARWPMGSRQYQYLQNPEEENPIYRIWKYKRS